MKIAVIADSHGGPIAFPAADLFIHAGDMTGWGKPQEVIALAARLRRNYKQSVLVPGNHDRCLESDPVDQLYNLSRSQHLLIDQAVEIDGFTIYGTPWTLPFFNWSYMCGEEEQEYLFRQMPDEIDILVTHGPAYGILDNGQGSKALRAAIERRNIRYHFFGHIHECGGKYHPVNVNGRVRHHFNVASAPAPGRPAPWRPPLLLTLEK